MAEYEIIILNDDRTVSAIVEQPHLDNNSAVRAARNMARGRRFEVWHNLDCVYRTPKVPRIPENVATYDL